MSADDMSAGPPLIGPGSDSNGGPITAFTPYMFWGLQNVADSDKIDRILIQRFDSGWQTEAVVSADTQTYGPLIPNYSYRLLLVFREVWGYSYHEISVDGERYSPSLDGNDVFASSSLVTSVASVSPGTNTTNYAANILTKSNIDGAPELPSEVVNVSILHSPLGSQVTQYSAVIPTLIRITPDTDEYRGSNISGSVNSLGEVTFYNIFDPTGTVIG
jgi:hypothetical protein